MEEQKCPYKILIADGGCDLSVERHLEKHAAYPSLDYEYLRYRPDQSFGDYYEKQMDVANRVTTEYLIFADNDDFYVISKFEALVDFLDKNSDYICARGQTVFFWLTTARQYADNIPYGHLCTAIHANESSIEKFSPPDRVGEFITKVNERDHFMTWYSVFRAGTVRTALASAYYKRTVDIFLSEVFFLSCVLMQGKSKVMDGVCYYRQIGSSQAHASIVADNPSAFRRIFSNHAIAQIYYFCKRMAAADGEVERSLVRYFSILLEQDCYHHYKQLSWFARLGLLIKRYPIFCFVLSKLLSMINANDKYASSLEIRRFLLPLENAADVDDIGVSVSEIQ